MQVKDSDGSFDAGPEFPPIITTTCSRSGLGDKDPDSLFDVGQNTPEMGKTTCSTSSFHQVGVHYPENTENCRTSWPPTKPMKMRTKELWRAQEREELRNADQNVDPVDFIRRTPFSLPFQAISPQTHSCAECTRALKLSHQSKLNYDSPEKKLTTTQTLLTKKEKLELKLIPSSKRKAAKNERAMLEEQKKVKQI